MTDLYTYTGRGSRLDEQAAWDYIHQGYLLSPRTVLKGRIKSPQPALPAVVGDLNDLPDAVRQTLEAAIGQVKGVRRAVMFSGGFDSMLMAGMVRRCGARVTALTVRFDGFNPLTADGASRAAEEIGIEHHFLDVKPVEFLSAVEELAGLTDEPVLDLDLSVVLAALKKYDPAKAGEVIISGMGSDQWYGNEALEARRGSLERRRDWVMVDVQAHQRVAERQGCRFSFPFLSPDMLSLSQAVPASLKKDKQLLRGLAVANGLAHRGAKSEWQVPALMRSILIKTYGRGAWPCEVSVADVKARGSDEVLRQIILGLWLKRSKKRMA